MKLVSYEETKVPLQDASFPIPQKVLDEMFKIMGEHKGIGLAAPQVGYHQKFFVGDLGNGKFVCANPKLYILRPQSHWKEEGCLTLPGEKHVVPRFLKIRLRGFDETGKPFDWSCIGLLAQLVQHEMDHLEGICIKDKLQKEKEKKDEEIRMGFERDALAWRRSGVGDHGKPDGLGSERELRRTDDQR